MSHKKIDDDFRRALEALGIDHLVATNMSDCQYGIWKARDNVPDATSLEFYSCAHRSGKRYLRHKVCVSTEYQAAVV